MIKKISAFTLIEVMITLVILGVLAGLALPMYNKTTEDARSNEARVNLQTIHYGEKVYRLNNNSFWPLAGTSKTSSANLAEINTALNIDLTTPQYYDITVTSSASTNYTATATRKGATRQYQIDQNGLVNPTAS
jgi:prepilin-type N-terminal cleavage/methylation domain-containing protein